MAAALLAALFAFGVFSPQGTPGVSAHECANPGDDHRDADPAGDATPVPCDAADGHDTTKNHEITGLLEEYTYTIAENVKGNGQLVARVRASFPSGDDVQYSLSNVAAGSDGERYLTIPDTGVIPAATVGAPTTNADDYLNIYPDGGIYYQEVDNRAADSTDPDPRNGFDWESITVGTPAQNNEDRTKPKVITAYIVATSEDTVGDDAVFVAKLTIMVTDVEAPPPTGLMAGPDVGTPAVGDTAAVPASATSIDVMWNKHPTINETAATVGASTAEYAIQYREVGETDDDWEDFDAGTDLRVFTDATDGLMHPTMATITGLDPKTDYEVQVRVAKPDTDTDDIADEWSDTVVGETVSMPTDDDKVMVIVTSDDQPSGTLMVSWTKADGMALGDHEVGGDSQGGYVVQYGERQTWSTTSDQTLLSLRVTGSSTTLTGLDNGTPYFVRVFPTNRAYSQSMAEMTPVAVSNTVSGTPYGGPSAPRNLQVVAVDHMNLLANWQAPSDMGGYDSVSYTVSYKEAGSTDEAMPMDATDATSASISGLDPDTLYQVQVVATNPKDGSQAAVSFGRTQMEPAGTPDPLAPAAPMSVSVSTIDHERLSVSWAAPAQAANTPSIDKYVVRYKRIVDTSFGTWMDADTDASHVLTGLMADTIYQIQVAAVNSAGTGASASGQGRTAVAPDEQPGRVKNGVALSSYEAGANIRIDIDVDADMAIAGGEDIVVELPKFGLPSSIDESDVLIDSDGYSGNPSDVTVSGSKITIEVPTREAAIGGSQRTSIPAGDYKIKLKQGAGITNPAAAGAQTIKVTDEDGDEEYEVTIVHVVKLSEDSVTRGDDLTLTLKGFANGTATVKINGDEVGQTEVAGNVGVFEIDTSASAVKAGQDNVVTVVDSKGENGGKGTSDSFTIKAKVAVDPESTTPSKDVTIKLSDWPASTAITGVTIGGETVSLTGVSGTTTDDKGAASFKVMVPRNVNTGTQTVSVTGKGTTASTTIGIDVLLLTISPATAVPGQQVTISGSGFKGNTDVTSLTIAGGDDVKPADASSTSSGNVSVTFKLPLDVGSGTKKIELEIDGRVGEGELTVPKPSIELNPAESVPGSVITVTGSGFAANERVEVSFKNAIEEIGRADGSGDVSVRLDIPSDAGVGSTNEVMLKTRPSDTVKYPDLDISAKADHKTPGPALTVSAEAQAGGHITISGTNFASFSNLTHVTIGGLDARPSPAPETDKNGAFEFQARVPRLNAGSHTVTVKDNKNNSATESFNLVTTAIVSTPQEIFGVLGDILVVVWRYDNASGTWASYDPAAPAEVNDLTGVSRGDIVWVQTTADYNFQGNSYLAGWNLYALE